jgi:DNA invertase Pin-like site-specific DNA recombinase
VFPGRRQPFRRRVVTTTAQDLETFHDLLYAVVTDQRNHEDSRRKGAAMTAGRRRAAARGDYIGYRPTATSWMFNDRERVA